LGNKRIIRKNDKKSDSIIGTSDSFKDEDKNDKKSESITVTSDSF
jgi:hypothetical protein